MALPLAPIAAVALRYGTVAMATYALARTVEKGRRDQRVEDALDDIDEGITTRRDPEQVNATARIIRTIRLGNTGPGVEIDLTSLTRIRFRKL
ncbi:hypothetical protein [Aliiroseovarius lamellibrachiae]|uniref:hypothetical protein n=1 Tax=Aliiroseovarius lamellibrachiae TaxID=1924933 RepID=UPI001BE0229E|nr:hypothetical protein [Aliiroseovarius lamellibrachiae]MBT2132307.1 hypothetical protein [Aliiroseovarius lamellibrachiae]